jgi:hypothetical protein
MTEKNLHERLEMLGFPVFEKNDMQTANSTLAEVVQSKDIRLREGFPVMLATSIEKHWFNYTEVLRHVGPQGTAGLDSFIVMSLAVYEVMHLTSPEIVILRKQFKSEDDRDFLYFRDKLKNDEDFTILGMTMSGERIKTAFNCYHGEIQAGITELLSIKDGHDLQFALSQIFSPKQKELVLKKLRAERLSKTEREYYSRTVRKKILALANPELHKLSQKLL